MSKTISIEQGKLQELYKTLTNYPAIAKEQVEYEFNKCFGKEAFEPMDVRERIKTFEDAVQALGEEHPFVIAYYNIADIDECAGDVEAFMKLRIITAALNEGWQPQFGEDEVRWYPWFVIYYPDELAEKSDEWKSERVIVPLDNYRVVGRSYNNANAYGGLVDANAGYASSYSSTSHGSRLAFKSKELCDYAARQFATIWADFYLIQK